MQERNDGAQSPSCDKPKTPAASLRFHCSLLMVSSSSPSPSSVGVAMVTLPGVAPSRRTRTRRPARSKVISNQCSSSGGIRNTLLGSAFPPSR